MPSLPQTICWKSGELYFLDQTLLPQKVVTVKQNNVQQVWDSIKQLRVRGAPAIGVAGAYGLLLAIKDKTGLQKSKFIKQIKSKAEYLDSARPTAVNLKWALDRMLDCSKSFSGDDPKELFKLMEEEAIRIHNEDEKLCLDIGKFGVSLIKKNMGVMTHCNAGALATTGIGTATAPMYMAHQKKLSFRVYSSETRPLLQGARLTSWELQQSGLDVTLLTDNMAAHIMSQGLIDLVITGADRVAANGDVANKIGTHGLAIIARNFGIPFYVACPYSTIDFKTSRGNDILIEQRETDEVTNLGMQRIAPENMKAQNPAFDVTPNDFLTGLITEKGIIGPPYKKNLQKKYL